MESLEAYVCDGIEPHSGNYYFIVGALCNTVTYSEAYQSVDLTEYRDCIEDGLAYIDYGGYLSNWGGDDHPEMKIAFFNENGLQIEQTDILDTYNSYWTLLRNEQQLPENTYSAKMILMGTRYAGDDNDSYFDDLFLKIWQHEDCFATVGDLNNDEIINILDVILIINLVLNNTYDYLGDLNTDGIINILDIVQLVTIILNY